MADPATEGMQLYVKMANKTISLEVGNVHTTVKELKTKIFKIEDIPNHQQCLMYLDERRNDTTGGQASQCILDDDKLTLFDYNITNGATLLLKVDEGNDISLGHVFTKSVANRTVTISGCRGSTTVSVLKDYIHDNLHIPRHEMKLVYGHHLLDDKHTLYYYNIEPDSVIHMVVRVPGGGNPYHLLSECPGCPGIRDCKMLKMCWDYAHILTRRSEDAWSVLCDIFNVERNVMKIIKENSESPGIRCTDIFHHLFHHLFHADPVLTLHNIKRKLTQSYPHLAEQM